MFEAIDVISAFSTPLKLAWVGWIAWGVGQYFWLRQQRSMPVRKVTSVAKPAKKPAVPKTVAAQAAEVPVVGRMFTPTHVVAEARVAGPVPADTQPMTDAAPVAPADAAAVPEQPAAAFEEKPAVAFDPSKAVIEQFGVANESPLDKFVRDFEMQDARPRRRKPTRLADAPSFGTEAPQVP